MGKIMDKENNCDLQLISISHKGSLSKLMSLYLDPAALPLYAESVHC